MKDVFVHPSALVESKEIGAGTRVWAFAHVMAGARIGARCNIGDHAYVEAGAVVGDNCTIKNGNMIWEGVTLEDGVFVGPQVHFTNDLRPRSPRLPDAVGRYASKANWLVPTRIRRGASLGAACVVLAGVTVGEFAMVGAAAVVTKDVPAHALVIGSPARRVGWACRCGQRLKFKAGRAACGSCRGSYRERSGAVSAVAHG